VLRRVLLTAILLITFMGTALLIVVLLIALPALFGLLLGQAASFAGGRPISPLRSTAKRLDCTASQSDGNDRGMPATRMVEKVQRVTRNREPGS